MKWSDTERQRLYVLAYVESKKAELIETESGLETARGWEVGEMGGTLVRGYISSPMCSVVTIINCTVLYA